MMLPDVVYHYRRHPGQMLQSTGFDDLEAAVRRITYERGRVLAETRSGTA